MTIEFAIGDHVYHMSRPEIIWIVEKIEEERIWCSTIKPETYEVKYEWLNKIAAVKINKDKIRTIRR